MSKYPLGSNLGGTGDWGGDWGFRVGIGFLKSFTGLSNYPLGGDWGGDWGFRVGIGFLRSFTG